MEGQRYQIGDVAGLLGMSRDTLRHYEKRGILSPMKGENGYRYYSDQDIHHLISILYQRKMNLGLSDMEQIWSGSNTIPKINGLLEKRISEEEKAIRLHRQAVARLRLSQQDYSRIENDLGVVRLQDIQPYYIIAPQATMEESVNLWFTYSQKYPGLDMTYLYDEYTWQRRDGKLETEYKNTQLILHQDLQEFVDYPLSPMPPRQTMQNQCVTVICASPSRRPETEVLEKLLSWADAQGLMASRRFYSTFLSQGKLEGASTWFLQVFLPVF